MALDQPFLKETPGAGNEILNHRQHSFVSLYTGRHSVFKEILSKSEFAKVVVINLP